jgi:hypothetical protein
MPQATRSGRDRDHQSDDETEKPNEQPTIGKTQHERFIETARELGCDEDEAAEAGFREKLKRIATAKPKPSKSGINPASGGLRVGTVINETR